MALRMITTSKVVFMTFDVLFDVVIFVVVINSFRRSENSLFDVLIALIILFDVVMVCMVFGVLFGFRRSDFRSSDLLPFLKGVNYVLASAKMSDFLSETDFISNLYQRELVHVLQITFMALPMKSLVDCKKVCHGEF